jgi:DNA invertase Pin-like site-specific DNA recombinase
MAIFAYGRVSTKDQSTENQRLDIERAGFKIDYWFALKDHNSEHYLAKFEMARQS